MTDRDEMMSAMYAQNEEPAEKREQPEQLRLAGKATLIPHGDKHLPVPRIEYVEALEAQLRKANQQIEEQNARLRKLELRIERITNIANRRLAAVESDVKNTRNNRWEY
jgi:UDP-2,3-diacylglucosamine pyrophosphatase LpxH